MMASHFEIVPLLLRVELFIWNKREGESRVRKRQNTYKREL